MTANTEIKEVNKQPETYRLNDLSAKEWVRETISVWAQRGLGKNHAHTLIEKEHPAPFSYQDVSRLVRFFTRRGDTVLDPFVGVGSTLKASALEGRNGIGIELNPRYAGLAHQRLENEVPLMFLMDTEQTILTGDARQILPTLPENQVSLVVTSPPYWNILHKVDHKARQERVSQGLDHIYSADTRDLGNIPEYDSFVVELGQVFSACRPILKPRAHLCLVVGDFRHKSKYYMFHADLATELEKRGFVTKGIIVLHQTQKRVFPYGYPAAFVPNLHHQYIVVMQLSDE